ncbi:MAG: hypothetical protein ACREXT_08030 [Gammaproteobacteria bacterium]
MGIDLSDFDTDGYRHNDFIDKQDGAIHLRFDGFDTLSLTLRAARHEDSHGLPGALSLEKFHQSAFSRRQTERPFDRGTTVDERYVAAFTIDTERFGKLDARGTYRDRENPFFIGFNPLGNAEDQRNRIDTRKHST